MFVGHKKRTDEETKKLIQIGARLREQKKKREQKEKDRAWLLDIREWKYPEKK
tara:strand:- start:2478 stop:2636 length:159 start_codon:yes stop_codon:yes gene_type:complete